MSTFPKIVPLKAVPRESCADLAELVARARHGEMEAWELLYAATFDPLYRRLRFMTGDANVAEELAQETYVQAMLGIDKFREDSTFPTWLSAVALNLVRKQWRREGAKGRAYARLQMVPSVLVRGDANPDEDILARQEEECLSQAVEQLPEKLREVFTLRYLEGVSCQEVAAIVGISENNVSVRAHRGRTQVREFLEREGVLDKETT